MKDHSRLCAAFFWLWAATCALLTVWLVSGCSESNKSPLIAAANLPATDSTNILWITNESSGLWELGTNFLTISNRPWVQFGSGTIVRVTDDEWSLITNYYRTNIRTEPIRFYGKRKTK